MANAEPDEREMLLREAPFVFKLLWYATRRSYQRMVDDAFGTEPRPSRVNGHTGPNGHNSNGFQGPNGHH
jgi:hypothetical protein